eukprot:CAMPEP_0185758100 /NCGR_PEP_ID=MMETSP1174-20130828/16662_1 /TAXON_ID=35687 /ORGANISM="Dictyocha speculum, Strain CCMP1381" /LENGTH=50 /DNA_ID=CAMNT_0028437789 /DNA_START=735 /DNA_END=887 /DNA_ORIENTATION=-
MKAFVEGRPAPLDDTLLQVVDELFHQLQHLGTGLQSDGAQLCDEVREDGL